VKGVSVFVFVCLRTTLPPSENTT